MFYLIGIGISEKDVSLKALESMKKCDELFLESYTSLSDISISNLEKISGKKIKKLYRSEVEENRRFLDASKSKNIGLLVYGDPLSATTHFEMIDELKQKKIKYEIIHSTSIFTLISETGLFLYKFGKTASIPFWEKNFEPESFFDLFLENQKIGAHTLFLLDLNPKEKKFMISSEAISVLLKIAKKRKSKLFDENTFCISCSCLGMKNSKLEIGTAKELFKKKFHNPPYCLIVPGKLSDFEEELLYSR